LRHTDSREKREATERPRQSGGLAMSFYIGQQVVCVKDQFSQWEYWRRSIRTLPTLNSIYTIRIIRRGEDYGQAPFAAFCFHELVNTPVLFRLGYFEPSFLSKYFRPVKKTSIDVFEKLLVPLDVAKAPKEPQPKTVVPA
jgi:hypothetical protein